MVAERLKELIDASPECKTVAFADLSIGMVLVTAGPENLSREALDRLCAEAGVTLGQDEVGQLGAKPAMSSISATPTDTKVFLRSSEEPNDALLCLCAPDVEVGGFLEKAEACLSAVSEGEQ